MPISIANTATSTVIPPVTLPSCGTRTVPFSIFLNAQRPGPLYAGLADALGLTDAR